MALSDRVNEVFEFGPFRLDAAERLLTRDGAPVPLAPKVFDTLVVLARGGGRLLTKDELMSELWPDTSVEEANLIVNISALRRALGEGRGGERYIETVPKRGYRLVAQVRAGGNEDDRAGGIQSGAGAHGGGVAGDGGAAPAKPVRAHASGIRYAAGVGLAIVAASGLALACLALALGGMLGRRGGAESPFNSMRIKRLSTTGDVGNAALSPDGNYLVYAVADGERSSLWVRQVSASNAVQIIPPARGVQFRGLTFSKDGKHVYYVLADKNGDGALYQMPVLGGAALHLLNDIDKPVTFSPDGKRFAFVRRDRASGESKVIIAGAGGEVERTLATRREPASYQWAAWSPDGSSIACSTRDADSEGGYASLVELSPSDGAERPFSGKRWYWAGHLAWRADAGGLIIAATDQALGMHNQIWEVPRGGGEPRRITNDLNSYVGFSLSGDSRALLAVAADRVSDIWVAPLGGGEPRRITNTRYEGFWGLSWAADGRLVYESSAGSHIQFWVTTEDGASQRQLTDDPHPKAFPAVSRDGRHVVFASARAGPMNLWRVAADGSNPLRLTFGREGDAYPACSPDDAWVVYEAKQRGVSTLWKVPLDGGGPPARLTDGPASRPAVSPRGDLIAFWSNDAKGEPSVAIISSDGGEPLRRLSIPSSAAGDRRAIRWTRAGDALSYVVTSAGVSNVWSLPVRGGPPRRLTDFQTELIFDFDWSPDGRRLAVSRGHFTRDIVIIQDFLR